jgi:hypothetical protein
VSEGGPVCRAVALPVAARSKAVLFRGWLFSRHAWANQEADERSDGAIGQRRNAAGGGPRNEALSGVLVSDATEQSLRRRVTRAEGVAHCDGPKKCLCRGRRRLVTVASSWRRGDSAATEAEGGGASRQTDELRRRSKRCSCMDTAATLQQGTP